MVNIEVSRRDELKGPTDAVRPPSPWLAAILDRSGDARGPQSRHHLRTSHSLF